VYGFVRPSLFHLTRAQRPGFWVGAALRLGLVGILVSLTPLKTRGVVSASHSSESQPQTSSPRLLVKTQSDLAAPGSSGSLDSSSLAQLGVSSTEPLFDTRQGDASLKQELGLDRVYIFTLSPSSDPQETLAALAADPAIEYAELDAIGYGAAVPDDTLFNLQWGLHNTGQSAGEPDADIDMPEAWELTAGITSTVIAIVDTGVDLDHPDLTGKIVPGYDFVNGDDTPQDDHGHGTHVSGIAAATRDNGTGIAGVCPQCRLMPLKALNDANWGYYSWWVSAIEYAVDHGASVINMSLGGTESSQTLHDAVLYAYSADVPIVAAMMNDGASTVYYPAVLTETIAVGATNRYDDRWSSSNYGDHIDLVAPGVSVWSTVWDDAYASWSGTSMATPHVTGVIGLMESIHPEYSVERVRSILRETADDQVGPPNEDKKGWDRYFGAGRLNGAQALQETTTPSLVVCHGGSCDFDTIQAAIDAASHGSIIKIAAGTYSTINTHGGLAQVVYIDKSVRLQGGYPETFNSPPNPSLYPTIVDAHGAGRGVYVTGGITPSIEGLHVTGGDAAGLSGGPGGGDAGGGVYVVQAHARISSTRIYSNSARWGGGLYLQESGTILRESSVLTNTAEWGAGLYLEDSTPAQVAGNTIAANKATYDGGGVYLRDSQPILTSNSIEGNTAGQAGGGLYFYQSAATLNATTVTANEAGEGGGLYLWKSDANVSACTVTSNSASAGGGLHLAHSDAILANCIVADNQAVSTASGLHIGSSSPRLLHTTIARNGGMSDTGVHVTNGSSVSLTNTIVVSHTIGITVAEDSDVLVNTMLWGAGFWANGADWAGEGTITAANNSWGDPAFVNPEAGDYHIEPSSAAADAGIDAGITTDVDGEQRPRGKGFDIGADEILPQAALRVAQRAFPNPARAGEPLIYTVRITNTGGVSLTLTITDTPPSHVIPSGTRVWTPAPLQPGAAWQETLVATVETGYNGLLTNTVQATSGEGITIANATVVFVPEQSVTVAPTQGGAIVASRGTSWTITIQIPVGAVTETTDLTYTPVSTATSCPAGYVFAGHAFSLDAFRGGIPQPGLVFESPVTITITYIDTGDLDENTLELYYWNGETWSTDGITVVERDALQSRLVARLEHLSEFAVFARRAQDHRIYLPLIVSRH
jgi:thermitase